MYIDIHIYKHINLSGSESEEIISTIVSGKNEAQEPYKEKWWCVVLSLNPYMGMWVWLLALHQ